MWSVFTFYNMEFYVHAEFHMPKCKMNVVSRLRRHFVITNLHELFLNFHFYSFNQDTYA